MCAWLRTSGRATPLLYGTAWLANWKTNAYVIYSAHARLKVLIGFKGIYIGFKVLIGFKGIYIGFKGCIQVFKGFNRF